MEDYPWHLIAPYKSDFWYHLHIFLNMRSKFFILNINHDSPTCPDFTFRRQTCCQCLNMLLQISLRADVLRRSDRNHLPLHNSLQLLSGKGKSLCLPDVCSDLSASRVNDMTNVVFCQWFEHNRLIQTVQKFRSEMCTQVIHDHVSVLLVLMLPSSSIPSSRYWRTDIGGHDQDRILKVYGTCPGNR